MAMPVVTEVQDLFRAVDGGATLALLAKLAMEKACTSKLDDTRSAIQVHLLPPHRMAPHKCPASCELPVKSSSLPV